MSDKELIDKARSLADAVCYDKPELAPNHDWTMGPELIVVDEIRELTDALEAALARESRLREALKFYSDPDCTGFNNDDSGKTAREALSAEDRG